MGLLTMYIAKTSLRFTNMRAIAQLMINVTINNLSNELIIYGAQMTFKHIVIQLRHTRA